MLAMLISSKLRNVKAIAQRHPLLSFFRRGMLSFFLLLSVLAPLSANDNFDKKTEEKLDNFLQIYIQNKEEGRQLLAEIESNVTSLTPPGTKVRLNTYIAMAQPEPYEAEFATSLLGKSWDLANRANDADVWSEVLTAHIHHYQQNGDQEKVVKLLDELIINAQNATVPRIRYISWHTIADIQSLQGRNDEALASYHKAYDSIEDHENGLNTTRKMYLRSSIAYLHASMRNYALAIEVINAGLEEAKTDPELKHLVVDFYLQKGTVLVDMGDEPGGLDNYLAALDAAISLDDIGSQAVLHNNIGDIYLRMRELEKSKEHLEKSLALSEDGNHNGLKALLKFNLGYVQLLSGEEADGLVQMESMLPDLKNLSGKTEYMAYLLEMADAYRIADQHLKEADTLRTYHALSEEVLIKERDEQINKLQEAFSAKEKAKEIESLTQQNKVKALEIEQKNLQQNLGILIVVVVLLVSILLLLLYRKVRHANLSLKEANEKLAYQSLRDPLTGLLNRRSLHEHMAKKKGDRRQGVSHATEGFILLDIDFFKNINDHYGHSAGDAVLVEIAKRLSKLTRSDDMVLRWGGEEFLILLHNINMVSLTQFTKRVLDAIGTEPVMFDNKPISVSASAGFLVYPFSSIHEDILDWQKTLQLADNALYLGKVHGRNRAYGLTKLHRPYSQIAIQLENDLSRAVEQELVSVTLVEGPPKEKLKPE